MTRPIPEHGTYARGRSGGKSERKACMCEPCRNAVRKLVKRARLRRARGIPEFADARPVRKHLQMLKAAGCSGLAISAASGVSDDTISKVLVGRLEQVQHATAAALLGVRPSADLQIGMVSSLGTVRRIQALVAVGHPMTVISARTGIVRQTVSHLANGHQGTVTIAVHRAVVTAFEELSSVPGESQRARNHAARQQWAGPLQWDEDAIDNPETGPDWTGHCGTIRGWHQHRIEELPMCDPCETAHQAWEEKHAQLSAAERDRLRRSERAAVGHTAALVENWAELQAQGYTTDEAAERLGVTRSSINKAVARMRELQEGAAA